MVCEAYEHCEMVVVKRDWIKWCCSRSAVQLIHSCSSEFICRERDGQNLIQTLATARCSLSCYSPHCIEAYMSPTLHRGLHVPHTASSKHMKWNTTGRQGGWHRPHISIGRQADRQGLKYNNLDLYDHTRYYDC